MITSIGVVKAYVQVPQHPLKKQKEWKTPQQDFPGAVDESLPVSAGDMDLILGPGRFHVLQSNWACAAQLLSPCSIEPVSCNYWAPMLQLLKPMCLELVLHNKRSHCNEKPSHHSEEYPRSLQLERACTKQQRLSAAKQLKRNLMCNVKRQKTANQEWEVASSN